MANLNINVFNELNMGAAQDFDGISMPNLGADFASKMSGVEASLENTAPNLTFGA